MPVWLTVNRPETHGQRRTQDEAAMRTRATLMPARRAASGLPPTAIDVQAEPRAVEHKVPIHRMASAIGTTIGTPSIGNTPVERFWLSRDTMKPPATDPGGDAGQQQSSSAATAMPARLPAPRS